ncbi:hypothetical protein N658DRAFT_491844 [Parathielavia hyrcaniae]|uniref:Uncharacterized protein n=1 Tax=Parathielavia hyrcaniae TaxID=113614 RepID=A0AAN6Q889_9PEZI|nr:hypothetical protein N658DRAFT_491844 [Parathielavia hyrcaniae]
MIGADRPRARHEAGTRLVIDGKPRPELVWSATAAIHRRARPVLGRETVVNRLLRYSQGQRHAS